MRHRSVCLEIKLPLRGMLLATLCLLSSCDSMPTDGTHDEWSELEGTLFVLDGLPGDLWAVDPRSGAHRAIEGLPTNTEASTILASKNGEFLLFGVGKLVRFDLATQELADLEQGGFAILSGSLSPSGQRLAVGRSTPEGYVVERGPVAGVRPQLYGPDRFNPVGRVTMLGEDSVLFGQRDSAGIINVHMVDGASSSRRRLGALMGAGMFTMAASPDGRAVAYVRRGANAEKLDVVIARAPDFAESTTIHIEGTALVGMDWSPDGRYLAVPRILPKGGIRVLLLHVASGHTREVASGELLCWDVAWSATPFVE